jgi:hypothetical protein
MTAANLLHILILFGVMTTTCPTRSVDWDGPSTVIDAYAWHMTDPELSLLRSAKRVPRFGIRHIGISIGILISFHCRANHAPMDATLIIQPKGLEEPYLGKCKCRNTNDCGGCGKLCTLFMLLMLLIRKWYEDKQGILSFYFQPQSKAGIRGWLTNATAVANKPNPLKARSALHPRNYPNIDLALAMISPVCAYRHRVSASQSF